MTLEARKIRLIMELRRGGIVDTAVLAAIERIPRETFVPAPFQDQSYENRTLPIGCGQTLSQPGVVALMTQALRPNRLIKVLEVGTGSGYQASILSRLFRRVYTIERYRELLKTAESRFDQLRISNITTRVGDGNLGWSEQAPFQRIIVTAAATDIPAKLVDQLGEDGVMVVPLARPNREQEVVRLIRGPNGFQEEHLTTVRFVPLVRGLPRASAIKSA